MRRGQIWSSDFALSLLIFIVASLMAYSVIADTLQHDEYADVAAQARTAADLLSGTGYPEHWTNDTIIRAGLRSDDHLSLRKAGELAALDAQRLRKSLRITDNAYVYFTNASNDTVPLSGACGIGPLAVTSTQNNATLTAAAISRGPHPVADALAVPVLAPEDALADLAPYDVLLIEGNISTEQSAQQVVLALDAASRRGITIVVIGDPGAGIFGIHVNSSAASSLTLPAGGLGMPAGQNIAVAGTLATIDAPNASLESFVALAKTDADGVAYATWLYNDADVWYLADTQGTLANGSTTLSIVTAGIDRMITVPRPVCAAVSVPDAKQVAVHRRTLPYHDELVTINVITWRAR